MLISFFSLSSLLTASSQQRANDLCTRIYSTTDDGDDETDDICERKDAFVDRGGIEILDLHVWEGSDYVWRRRSKTKDISLRPTALHLYICPLLVPLFSFLLSLLGLVCLHVRAGLPTPNHQKLSLNLKKEHH